MLYAIVENLIFLLIAALLGGIIGWLLRAPRLRKQLEEIWRRRVEEEHEGRKRNQRQLSEAREALAEAESDDATEGEGDTHENKDDTGVGNPWGLEDSGAGSTGPARAKPW